MALTTRYGFPRDPLFASFDGVNYNALRHFAEQINRRQAPCSSSINVL